MLGSTPLVTVCSDTVSSTTSVTYFAAPSVKSLACSSEFQCRFEQPHRHRLAGERLAVAVACSRISGRQSHPPSPGSAAPSRPSTKGGSAEHLLGAGDGLVVVAGDRRLDHVAARLAVGSIVGFELPGAPRPGRRSCRPAPAPASSRTRRRRRSARRSKRGSPRALAASRRRGTASRATGSAGRRPGRRRSRSRSGSTWNGSSSGRLGRAVQQHLEGRQAVGLLLEAASRRTVIAVRRSISTRT